MNQEELDRKFENLWRIYGNSERMNQNKAVMSFDEFFEYIKELCRKFFTGGVAVGESASETEVSTSVPKKSTNLFERSIPFNQSVFNTANIQKYGQQMLEDFYEYWSEPNPSHTKMRFELQKTWDTSRRLARWARNNFNGNRNGNKPDNNQQRLDKLASILTD